MRHRLVSEDDLVAMTRDGQDVDGATVAAYGLLLLAVTAGTVHAGVAAEGVNGMAHEDEQRVAPEPADWALDQARDELDDDAEPGAVRQRAEELLREAQERDDERHDEYDDPDQGGEA